MDGINPTLAFAALFLGLSGHPRDVAEQPVEPEQTKNWEAPGPSDQQIGYLFDCPGAAVAFDDQDAPIAPQGFGPLRDQKIALASSVLTLESDTTETPSMPGELSGEIFQDQDGCAELAPQP
jgi:hypothetical protein